MPKNRKQRLNALLRVWRDCTPDQIANDIKEVRRILNVNGVKRKKRETARFIPREKANQLFAAIDATFKRPHTRQVMDMFMALMLDTGCRISEALHIELGDVDLAERFIRLRIAKNGRERQVVFSRNLQEKLRTYVRGLPSNQKFLFEKNRDGLAFGLYSTRAIQRNLERLRECAGKLYNDDFSDITSHVFRHDWGTRRVAAGLPTVFAQKQYGHASPVTTSNEYISNNPLLRREEMDRANLRVMAQGF